MGVLYPKNKEKRKKKAFFELFEKKTCAGIIAGGLSYRGVTGQSPVTKRFLRF
jgi:hypothetical protein